MKEIKPKSIVVVEDDESDFFLFKKGLARAGYEGVLEHATSADLAYRALLEFLDSGEGLPELVVVDLGLPGESGLEMIGKLKAEPVLQALRIVVVSGSERIADVAAARELGADWFFKKCDTPKEMDFVIRTILSFGWETE